LRSAVLFANDIVAIHVTDANKKSDAVKMERRRAGLDAGISKTGKLVK